MSEIGTQPAAFYDTWLSIFGEAREIAHAIQYRGYYIGAPEVGLPTVEQVRAASTPEQWSRLMDHALCLASLQGNAFPDLVEQYVPEALVNLHNNGWADGGRYPTLPGATNGPDLGQARTPAGKVT